ncbi:hypothetical protein ENBRE01_2213 [Enteropsectra breve]|nr:hypothetical protein ENBRE01_2213 [Enteropsectra breve]
MLRCFFKLIAGAMSFANLSISILIKSINSQSESSVNSPASTESNNSDRDTPEGPKHEYYINVTNYFTVPYPVEPARIASENKEKKIAFQKQVLEKRCAYCNKLLCLKLFPASVSFEKIMGISEFPYKYEVVSSFDLHIKRYGKGCFIIHQFCSLLSVKNKSEEKKFYGFDFSWCLCCGLPSSNIDVSEKALESLLNSSKPYEFAYIHRTIIRYYGDIRGVLEQTDADVETAQKIITSAEKCEFKGKKSLLASLRFYIMDRDTKDKINIIGNFIEYSLYDSKVNHSEYWENVLELCTDEEEIKKCLLNANNLLNQMTVEKYVFFFGGYMRACARYFSEVELLRFITLNLFSSKCFLLCFLEVALDVITVSMFPELKGLNKLPSAFRTLNIVESYFTNVDDSTLTKGQMSVASIAVARIITSKPYYEIAFEAMPIFVYIKRLYKLKNRNQDKKNYMFFCDNLVLFLLKSYDVDEEAEIEDNLKIYGKLMVLKVSLFYNKIFKYSMHQRLFLANTFEALDQWDENNKMVSKMIENHFSVEERKEILLLRVLNSCSKVNSERQMILCPQGTEKVVANELVKHGRLLMREGLESVPLMCRVFSKNDQYKDFLRDMCYSKQLHLCSLDSKIIEDLSRECKSYPRLDTGLLPLLQEFYVLLDCENWQKNEVLEWCEKVNLVDILADLYQDERYKTVKYRFIKTHFTTILQYVLDKAADVVNDVAVLLEVICWLSSLAGNNHKYFVHIFDALSASKNGYFHANIYFLMNCKSTRQVIVFHLMDKLIEQNHSASVPPRGVLELQHKYLKFIKEWEKTDVILKFDPAMLECGFSCLVEKLEKIQNLKQLQVLFADFVKSSSALKVIKRENLTFYKLRIDSMEFIPQLLIERFAK